MLTDFRHNLRLLFEVLILDTRDLIGLGLKVLSDWYDAIPTLWDSPIARLIAVLFILGVVYFFVPEAM